MRPAILLALLLAGCASSPCRSAADELFRVEYSPGFVVTKARVYRFTLAVNPDGTLILTPSRGTPRCATLSRSELAAIRVAFDGATQTPTAPEHIDDDSQVTLAHGTARWFFEHYPRHLTPEALAFIELLDAAAQRHFGRAYNHALRQ